MSKLLLSKKINESIENCDSYITKIKEKISELSGLENAGAVFLGRGLSSEDKAKITYRLYKKGIINRFFETRNSSDESFERILTEIAKVIAEVRPNSESGSVEANNKFSRTIWLSDAARPAFEIGTKIYRTKNLMLKVIFGINQFWYELFTKGPRGKYVSDYYGRSRPDQRYYYLPHNDRRFCHTTSDFLLTNHDIAGFLKKRENHWKNLYSGEMDIADQRVEKILAFAYLNRDKPGSQIYLKKDPQKNKLKLVLDLTVTKEELGDKVLSDNYGLITDLNFLRIVLVLAQSGVLLKCEDGDDRVNGSGPKSFGIQAFLNKNTGFGFISELANSLQSNKAALVKKLNDRCFLNDPNKGPVIEQFLFDTINRRIDEWIAAKIESKTSRASLIRNLKEAISNFQHNYEILEKEQNVDADLLLTDRIKNQFAGWVLEASTRHKEEAKKEKSVITSDKLTYWS